MTINTNAVLWQWDSDVRIKLPGVAIGDEVHWVSGDDVLSALVGDDLAADVPNVLLQTAGTIKCYHYRTDHTVSYWTGKVMAREKPPEYVYTQTEVDSWEKLDARMAAMEQADRDYVQQMLDIQGEFDQQAEAVYSAAKNAMAAEVSATANAADAQAAREGAETAATSAETASLSAQQSASAAATAKSDAVTAKSDAVAAKNAAVTAKDAAETASASAAGSASAAATAKSDAETAKDAAEQAAASLCAEFEIVETITISTDTAAVNRTQWPDGTPYDFGSVLVVVDAAAGAASYNGALYIYSLDGATNLPMTLANAFGTSAKHSAGLYLRQGNIALLFARSASAGAVSAVTSALIGIKPNAPRIGRVYMTGASVSQPITAGTVITIYGVV